MENRLKEFLDLQTLKVEEDDIIILRMDLDAYIDISNKNLTQLTERLSKHFPNNKSIILPKEYKIQRLGIATLADLELQTASFNYLTDKKQRGNMSSVEVIVKDYLKKNGYEGLVDHNGECSCDLKDFMPCEGTEVQGCEPGYKVPCTCGEKCDWHIATKKPTTNFPD